jgi:hypothetical protein
MTNESLNTAIADPDRLWQVPETIMELMNERASEVFRKDLSQPGFAVIDLGPDFDSVRFRSMLIGFYSALDGIYLRDFSRRLVLRSVGRFDQKVTSDAHLDGAPDESILMLGYEPSEIQSRLSLIDYTRCAADRGLTPVEFLRRFHLGSDSTSEVLASYATAATPFDSRHYRIVIINNSRLAVSAGKTGMLGVLHKSTVFAHEPGQRRMINTLLMSPEPPWADDLISLETLRSYINSGSFGTA